MEITVWMEHEERKVQKEFQEKEVEWDQRVQSVHVVKQAHKEILALRLDAPTGLVTKTNVISTSPTAGIFCQKMSLITIHQLVAIGPHLMNCEAEKYSTRLI